MSRKKSSRNPVFKSVRLTDLFEGLSPVQRAQAKEVFEQPIVQDIFEAGGVLSGGYVALLLEAYLNEDESKDLNPTNAKLHPLEKIDLAKRLLEFQPLNVESEVDEEISWVEFVQWAKEEFPVSFPKVFIGRNSGKIEEELTGVFKDVWYLLTEHSLARSFAVEKLKAPQQPC
jgi:hypothetical protein